MARHNDLGRKGEAMAVRFLRRKHFEILETNWRRGRGEIDIIARDGDVLVFVEVKTRTGNHFAQPEHFVSPLKMKHIAVMAAMYVEEMEFEGELRFDVIGIWREAQDLHTLHLRYFADAFFPAWS